MSRLCIFTVLNLDEVYLPHVEIELMNCLHLCWVVLGETPGANEEWLAI